jgi:hypothetical protein
MQVTGTQPRVNALSTLWVVNTGPTYDEPGAASNAQLGFVSKVLCIRLVRSLESGVLRHF